MEEEFFQYINENNKTPIGHTELNKEELIQEYKSKGKNILDLTNEE